MDPTTLTTPAHSTRPSGNTHCHNCGAYVSRAFVRVFGNNDGEVHACLECSTGRDLREGQGTGR